MGQASFLLRETSSKEQAVFFESAHAMLGDTLYIPFLILVIVAGIIASQALISGAFSIVFQAINVRIAPLLNIKHTSTELSTQIYIPAVNWTLMVGVIFMYFNFKTSDNMVSAYGFAVSAVMTITGLFLTFIHFLKREVFYFLGSVFLLFVDIAFFLSNFYKIPHGAYWSVIFATVPYL
jgi:KUP system potassium uptake protein